jgi:hypothetical protein
MNKQKKFAITPTKSIPLATTHAIKITTKERCQNQLIEWSAILDDLREVKVVQHAADSMTMILGL